MLFFGPFFFLIGLCLLAAAASLGGEFKEYAHTPGHEDQRRPERGHDGDLPPEEGRGSEVHEEERQHQAV